MTIIENLSLCGDKAFVIFLENTHFGPMYKLKMEVRFFTSL